MLEAAGLSCRRGDRVLFRGLDFRVEPGELLWIRGSNGSGKTTLLRTLVKLSHPEAGDLRWKGHPVAARDSRYLEDVVYVGHTNALKDDLSVIEALGFLARLYGRPSDPENLIEALKVFGVAALRVRAVRTLSQGQRRRVALARLALDATARLWILDEPFDALDTAGIAQLNRLIERHLEQQGSVILTSHQLLTLDSTRVREADLDRYR